MNDNSNIPITRIEIGEEEKRRVLEVLDSGWIVQGKQVAEFEQRIAERVAATHAVATTSCTTALHLAVAALGVKEGDEVIVPAFTWVSTASAVKHCGGTPVFCDVDLYTQNIDVTKLESLFSPRTVGVIPVHLFGLPADMDAINAIAKAHNCWVLEDAACALGTTYNGAPAGSLGDAACFSFHPRKSITTGEGGMVTTNDDNLAATCHALRNHGATVSNLARHQSRTGALLPEFNMFGYNYRMTDLQAAVGNGQLDHLDDWVNRRRALAADYRRHLADVNWLTPPIDDPGHSYQSFVCVYEPEKPSLDNLAALEQRRDALLIALEDHGITSRQGTHAPVRLGCYRDAMNIQPKDFPNAWMAHGLTIALPLFPSMTDDQTQRVVDVLRSLKS